MSITWISPYQVLVWWLVTLLVLVLYMWKVRPLIADRPEFKYFFSWTIWFKERWDVTLAMVIAALPSVWNGLMDLIIFISLTVSDALPAIAGMDLSAWVLPSWAETAIRVSAVVVPIIRARLTT